MIVECAIVLIIGCTTGIFCYYYC